MARDFMNLRPTKQWQQFVSVIATLLILALMIWVCLFLWVHQVIGVLTFGLIVCFVVCAMLICWHNCQRWLSEHHQWSVPASYLKLAKCGFWGLTLLAVTSFFAMPARNDRNWYPEVMRQVDFEQQGSHIKVYNVRNFDWQSPTQYQQNWQTRQYDLDKLSSMDLILSIWDNPNIAHTMISFGFDDGQRLVFSVEIRKEIGESFSSIGGFFRLYELSVIAADEKDVIYTRSNIRKESVYLYPVRYEKAKMQQLFLTYLHAGQNLQTRPRWYNTLLSNCTTVIYDMVKQIDDVPMDYRILVSGRLPDYLYELGVLDNRYSLAQLKQLAHINPKLEQYGHMSSDQYSTIIRQGLSD